MDFCLALILYTRYSYFKCAPIKFKVGVLFSVFKADIAKYLPSKIRKTAAAIKFAEQKNSGRSVAAFWRINLILG